MRRADHGTATAGNLFWFVLASLWLAIAHAVTGSLLCISPRRATRIRGRVRHRYGPRRRVLRETSPRSHAHQPTVDKV
ncbi:MAG: YccF domain-containing protein [Kineosporiaceae bacterium]|nr:YccF domain-containing protein [Aeromicrobium sp.]